MSEYAVILVAEDSRDDALTVRRALVRAKVLNPIYFVEDGLEVLAYLKGEGKFAVRSEYPLPELLLLDLRMPRMDGFEVLRWIREQPALKSLRIVVLTGSDRMDDVNRAYEMGANSFLVKPIQFDQFVQLAASLQGHWLWVSETPTIRRSASVHALQEKPSPET